MGYTNFGRYKGLFLSVTLFVVFFLAYLALSLHQQNKTISHVALSDYVALLTDDLVPSESTVTEQSTSELKKKLNLIKSGGKFLASDGTTYKAPAIDAYLAPKKSNINQVIASLAKQENAETARLLKQLSKDVTDKKDRDVKLLNTLQIVALIATLLLYVLILIQLISRLSKADDIDVESKKETEGILNTVNEGLFLLGKDHQISIEQSSSFREMFRLDRAIEGDFFDFISDYITESNVQIAKDYMELLFGDRVKENLVKDLNPLLEVEINIVRRDGTYENRYLDFNFKRVMIDDKLSHLLGSVTDVTRRVKLEKELEESKLEQEAQLDLLLSILHIDSKQLSSFFEVTEESLTDINKTLEGHGHSNQEVRLKLSDIANKIHRIKGDAAALGLYKFEFSAHNMEDEIDTIKSLDGPITGNQLLPITSRLRDLFTELNSMQSLVSKLTSNLGQNTFNTTSNEMTEKKSSDASQVSDIDELNDASANAAEILDSELLGSDPITSEAVAASVSNSTETESESSSFDDALTHLATTVGDRNNVSTNLKTTGFVDITLPDSINKDLQSIAVQLVRNSIVHGGETTEQRLEKGKPESLNIDISLTETDDKYTMIVRDDGRGINVENIIDKAIAKGMLNKDGMDNFDKRSVIKLIFSSGFSSKDEAGVDAGRGVGLNLVKNLVNDNKGNISIKTNPDKFCQFSISLPKAS